MKTTLRHSKTFRWTALLLLAASVALTGCRSSSARADEVPAERQIDRSERSQELFIQGTTALDNRDWDTAIRRFEVVAQEEPQRWQAHMNRGIALLGKNDFRQATEAFGDAITAGGAEEPELYFNLGNLYQERGLYDIAVDSYRHSMALGGEDYETLLNLAAAYTFLGAHENAVLTVERAIQINPDDHRAYMSRGLLYHVMQQPDRALETFEQILSSHPNLAEAHYNRGFVLSRLYRDREAIAAMQRYLELAPDGPYTRQAESLINTIQRRLDRSNN